MATPLEIIEQKKTDAIERLDATVSESTIKVNVGMATCEIAAGSRNVMAVFRDAIDSGEVSGIALGQKGCAGRCYLEPTVEVFIPGETPYKYGKVDAERAKEILQRHLKNGEVIQEWLI